MILTIVEPCLEAMWKREIWQNKRKKNHIECVVLIFPHFFTWRARPQFRQRPWQPIRKNDASEINIFLKNRVESRTFVGNKDMGEIKVFIENRWISIMYYLCNNVSRQHSFHLSGRLGALASSGVSATTKVLPTLGSESAWTEWLSSVLCAML